MSKYAKIENNIVTNVIICDDLNINSIPGEYIKSTEENGSPIIGGTFNHNLNKFIMPKPYESWVLDENTLLWESPIGANPDILTKIWDEDSQSWVDRP